MGWAELPVLEADGSEVETGSYKLWSSLPDEQDVGVDAASNHALAVFDWLCHRQLLGSVSALKVSTDAPVTLVVYLGVGVDYDAPCARDVVDVIRQYCGAPAVKAGWAHVAGSKVLATF